MCKVWKYKRIVESKECTRRCKFIECTVNQSDSFSGFCTYEVDVRGQSESVLYIHLGRSRDSEGTGPSCMQDATFVS